MGLKLRTHAHPEQGTEVRLVLDGAEIKTEGCDLQLPDNLSHPVPPII